MKNTLPPHRSSLSLVGGSFTVTREFVKVKGAKVKRVHTHRHTHMCTHMPVHACLTLLLN